MKKFLILAVMLAPLVLATQALGQANATLSGTIQDATQAVLPGVTVTATNNETGVSRTAVSNAAGVYNFPGLQVGTYKVSAEMSGFQTHTFTDVIVGNAAQVRLNFTLQVRKLEQQIEVSVASDRLLLESSSSVGTVLPEKQVIDLPLVNNNVLDLMKVMGGTVMTTDEIWNADATTFAGINASNVNLQRDGVTVNDLRWNNGLASNVRLNPDLIGEFKMVLAPVDAEMGRGAGQLQLITKSGANAYHGALVWNLQNTKLDSNQWWNNRQGIIPDWRNLNEWTASVGGPIVKNKTFFFGLYDGQSAKLRRSANRVVLTPCARKGIFRYFDYWGNGNRLQETVVPGGFGTPYTTVIDANGNPMMPTTKPDGTAFDGQLRIAHAFGQIVPGSVAANDCSDYDPATDLIPFTAWDALRSTWDTTGNVSQFLTYVPQPNNWDAGDGLNTAGYRYTEHLNSADSVYGIGEDPQRQQFTVRIDHNFNPNHRISGIWTYESDWADDNFKTLPEYWGGRLERKPQTYSVNLTSTLKPTLLNEARFGLSIVNTNTYNAYGNPENDANELLSKFPVINGTPVIWGPGQGGVTGRVDLGANHTNPFGSRGNLPYNFGGIDHRWVVGDTVTWTKNRHSFKWGGEVRLGSSDQTTDGGMLGFFSGAAFSYPYAMGGSTQLAPNSGVWFSPFLPNIAGYSTSLFGGAGNVATMENLINYLSGSLSGISQFLFVNSPNQTSYNNPATDDKYMRRKFIINEFDLFVKDDWKATDNLTLNLGLRFEYYGVPYVTDGLTAGFLGGGNALFSMSGRTFNEAFWNPGTRAELSQQAYIGPDSANPDEHPYESDWNNFGPAVGFAYQLPFWGKGKTTIRGGYQMSYMPISRLDSQFGASGVIGNVPGTYYPNTFSGNSTNAFLSMANVSNYIPVPVYAGYEAGMKMIPVSQRARTVSVYDPNFRNPYAQTLTLAVTRNITSNLTIDVKYIGTLSRKSPGQQNLNAANFLKNGLKDAFDAARRGEDNVPLLDQMLQGINLVADQFPFQNSHGPVGTMAGGVLQTGAMHLRASTSTQANLANGDYAALANTLATLNYSKQQFFPGAYMYPGNQNLPDIPDGANGGVLRYNNFPENFIYTSPQFSAVNYSGNFNHANYHSMQAQITLRPTHGLSVVGTYTWAKNLGVSGGITDPLDRAADYTLLSGSRAHTFIAYGSYDLPFGPNKMLFSGSSGALARIVEGWQLSWIYNYSTGSPLSVNARSGLYGNGVPDLVDPSFDTKSAQLTWSANAPSGSLFGIEGENVTDSVYAKKRDPQCANVTAKDGLNGQCTLNAIVLASDPTHVIFQNPQPGQRGSFGRNNLTGLGMWSADIAMSKRVQITESKSIQVRVDAKNIFNHPMASYGQFNSGVRIVVPGDAWMNMNPTFDMSTFTMADWNIGYFDRKVGNRTFQAKIRLDF